MHMDQVYKQRKFGKKYGSSGVYNTNLMALCNHYFAYLFNVKIWL